MTETTKISRLSKLTTVQIADQISRMCPPMEELKPKRPVGIIGADIISQPYYVAHIQSDIADVINGIPHSHRGMRLIYGVCQRVKAVGGKSSTHLMKKG